MRTVKVGDLLMKVKDLVLVEDDVMYKRVTVKTKGQGVFLRDQKIGKQIGTKRQFRIKENQFLLSKIDARYGAFGIVTKELEDAIITGNFWTYNVNSKKVNIHWFNHFVNTDRFINMCEYASVGTTNRKYLNEDQFLNVTLQLPEIEEQAETINKLNKIARMLKEVDRQKSIICEMKKVIVEEAFN
ncbi:restriction endonuclease subunit S [Priestia iocasae]|uniref:Restriction endonuclease S subunit n=1 Tax=Priestia iocasae TaxID=2291674 RepID=A0ABS2QVQ5_9BACI|nr:restriction endonuclease subunit S [Metabacillus iocasae]MBM7703278.1 restriction endonuclease S subunit [Metabacillus iocasae]